MPQYGKICHGRGVDLSVSYETQQRAGLSALVDLSRQERARGGYAGQHVSPRRAVMSDMGHRLSVAVTVSLVMVLLYVVEQRLWPHQGVIRTPLRHVWSLSSVLWLSATVPALFELAGLFLYQHARGLHRVQPVEQVVCWRIVSRGLNVDALTATINRVRHEMAVTPLFLYRIEVVIDTSYRGLPPPGRDLHYIIVPKGYQTANGTKAKARALNYALLVSPIPDTAWIVHLDEETHPTPSGIAGIARAIAEEDASGRLRIGQGTITYHRNWSEHPLLTLSDCIRTGSDLGRLYLSMKIGVPLFGLHGSFIVVRNDVEKSVGFDLGPGGSLTEDAWWGCLQMQQGRRCRWVDGYLEEQSTQQVRDFMKQRRRWFNGLVVTALRAPTKLRYRGVLGVTMLAWALSPLAWVYTVAHFTMGGPVPAEVRLLANLSLGIYVATTFVGLRVNLTEHGVTNIFRRVGWYALWVVMLPAFSFMEATGVAYGIVKPSMKFHVVRK